MSPYAHRAGDPAVIDTLRRIADTGQDTTINGTLIEARWARLTVGIWHRLDTEQQQQLLQLPPADLVLQCVGIHALAQRHRPARQPNNDEPRTRPPQWFHFGPWIFSITAAEALITLHPRPAQPLAVATWAGAYGLTHLDNPESTTIGLIGPVRSEFNREYAMGTDLSTPLLIAQIPIPDTAPAPLLIDGTHRLYRAWRENVPQLPAYLLTPAETLQIRHHVTHPPRRTHGGTSR